MSELDSFLKTRRYTRQKVTKLCSKISDDIETLTSEQLSAYIDRLQYINTELITVGKEILKRGIQDGLTESKLDALFVDDDQYEENISLCFAHLKSKSTPAADVGSNLEPNTNIQTAHKLKLPQISLPRFGNRKGENVQKFLRSLESVLSKRGLGSFEKFVYLHKQLYDSPLILVDSLDVSEQSYEIASELLVKAFDSNLTSKYSVIEKLAELNMSLGTDPYAFIGEMRTIISGVKTLTITTDEILQYFIWQAMNNDFQSHLTSITNKSKPSLQEISDNVFEATDRYVKQNERKESLKSAKSKTIPSSTLVSAVNIQEPKSKAFCVLCSNDKNSSDHPMISCPIYSNARKRVDKLRAMNACTKCSFKNHSTNDCKFKFKSACRHCNESHMSYLCLKTPSDSGSRSVSFNATVSDSLEHDSDSEPESELETSTGV